MKVAVANQAPQSIAVDVLAIGVKADNLKKDESLSQIDRAMKGALSKWLEKENFKANSGDTLTLTLPAGLAASRLLVVGLGKGSLSEPDARLLGVKAATAAKSQSTLAVVAPSNTPGALRALTEGVITGAYRFTSYFTGDRKPKRVLESVTLVSRGKIAKETAQAIVQRGTAVADAINLARDLVNAPPNDMHPTALAEISRAEAEKLGLQVKILDKKQIEEKGMNLLLAVNRGSAQEPRFIHVAYKPKKSKKRVVFVGKGLTFDSGGLCLKPAKSMLDMKCDMAGGAMTIATVLAAAKLQLPVEVHAVIPATENMTGSNAYRPSDVFTSLDGKTVEIINTDAEGRLILADALVYARDLKPDVLVDHATLTGACMVALGAYTAGLFSNDDALAAQYAQAAKDAGESFWRLPLNDDLRDQLKSDIADLKHTGESYGGSITAALFLREFVGKCKWLHLDIAGPAYGDRAHGINPRGGTGFGVLTAVRFLESLRA